MIANITNGTSFRGCLTYVFREDSKAELIGGNIFGESISEIAQAFAEIRGVRENIIKPVWHVSLSCPGQEILREEKWCEIAENYLEGMGLRTNNHQYVVVRHGDKEYDHVHLVVNRIGANGKVYHNKFDRYKSKKLVREMERVHELVPTYERGRESKIERVMERLR